MNPGPWPISSGLSCTVSDASLYYCPTWSWLRGWSPPGGLKICILAGPSPGQSWSSLNIIVSLSARVGVFVAEIPSSLDNHGLIFFCLSAEGFHDRVGTRVSCWVGLEGNVLCWLGVNQSTRLCGLSAQGARGAEGCGHGQQEGAPGAVRVPTSEHCRRVMMAGPVRGSRRGAWGSSPAEPPSAPWSFGREARRVCGCLLSPSQATTCLSPGHPQHSLRPAPPSRGLCQHG